MKTLWQALRNWWAGIQEQITLILFTQAVLTLSKLAKPKAQAWALKLNQSTDKRFGQKADVVQREIADVLELVAKALRT